MSEALKAPPSDEVAAVDVTPALGKWISELELEAVPAEVLAHIKLCILDSIGCGFYGAQQPWGRIAAGVALEMSGGGTASLFNRSEKAGPADAAMANGTAIHGFEIDDLHVAGMCHPGSATVPAALAAGEAAGASGRDFLAAVIAGYEVGIRVGLCAGVSHSTSGYHGAATSGTLCGGAAAARVLGLDAEQSTHSLGIAATQAAGLYSARKGAMTKRFHAGRAAQSGVVAGFLARRGFTGSREAIEAPFGGFMSTMNGQSDPAMILDGLGERWETLGVGFKIYAACGSTHTTVDALDELMRQGLTAENLSELSVAMTKKAMTNIGWPYQPGGVVSAQMNGYYTAAVKLLDGDAFIDQFREERMADPRILDLTKRIRLRHDPELDLGGAAKRHTVKVEARLTDGRTLKTELQYRRGSAERPITASDVEAKFRKLATKSVSEASVDAIVALIHRIETERDLASLSAHLRAAQM